MSTNDELLINLTREIADLRTELKEAKAVATDAKAVATDAKTVATNAQKTATKANETLCNFARKVEATSKQQLRAACEILEKPMPLETVRDRKARLKRIHGE